MDFQRVFDILHYQNELYPQKVALAHKEGIEWKKFDTTQCISEVNKISAGAIDLGLHKGDKVAIIAHTSSSHWNFFDLGLQQIGVVLVPIYPTVSDEVMHFVLQDAEVKYCLVSNQDLYDKVKRLEENLPFLEQIFTIEKLTNVPNIDDWKKEPTAKHLATLEGLKAMLHEDDLVTIIYTSGTTGQPKGVMLSHKNIVSNIKATIAVVPINCDKVCLSFLPMSHIFERMVVFTYIAVGASIYYAERIDTLVDNLQEIRPHFFTSVPRLLEKVYENIVERSMKANVVAKKLSFWALGLGRKYKDTGRMSLPFFIKLKIADFLIYRKWRKALGGRIEGVVVGAAALQPELGRLFTAAGIDIREGYGLTETSPVIAFNRFEPGGVRFGTVGMPIPGVEVKIENPDENGEGEIMVKGPNVMQGYYKREDLTQKVLLEDGWFKTGDIGTFLDKRFLKITDRKKDLFKTSGGKYVAPQAVENALRSSPYIKQCMVIGNNRQFVSALVIPFFPELEMWCIENNIHWTAPQYMVINPKVVAFMEEEVAKINKGLNKTEQVKKFHLLHQEWSVENGELTPTMKIRRRIVLEHFEREINEMYGIAKKKKN